MDAGVCNGCKPGRYRAGVGVTGPAGARSFVVDCVLLSDLLGSPIYRKR
jgi:hypothetical protein